jgi:DNA repair protein RadC
MTEIKHLTPADISLDSVHYIRRIETTLVDDGTFVYNGLALDNPEKLSRVFKKIGTQGREQGIVLFLNREYIPLGYDLFLGGMDFVTIDPRRIIILAGLLLAPIVVIAHNHPASSANPSIADREFALMCTVSCRTLGISLVDFLIVATSGLYYSFREHGECGFESGSEPPNFQIG